MTIMPPTLSITCKTVQLHANSPVSRPEVDPKVTTGISSVLIGPLWERGRDGERVRGDAEKRREGARERWRQSRECGARFTLVSCFHTHIENKSDFA